MTNSLPEQAKQTILHKIPGAVPEVAMILGSGLNALADQIQDTQTIPYGDIPGFADSTVAGHHGQLVLGTWHSIPIACLQGRNHYYEHGHMDPMKTAIRALRLLGCNTLLLTNAVGSLHMHMAPGSLLLVHDHINFQGYNPLVGELEQQFGPRFVPLNDAYDADLRVMLEKAAENIHCELFEGVYLAVSGPNFETQAEIQAFRTLGADVVGMSTVPEVIIAKHCGFRVAALSVITNLAAGLSPTPLSHEETLAIGNQSSQQLIELISEFLRLYSQQARV